MPLNEPVPAIMTYIDCPRPGGPEVLTPAKGTTPIPKDEEILIRVEAAGVNRPDIAGRMGKYPPPPGASPILGLEVAGVVVQAGKDARTRVGERVCALAPGGGYAEYCVVPDRHALPIPNGVSIEEAAGIPETFFTVWANVFQIGRLAEGERFLVHGGTSGIGTTAIQMARAFGAIPYATAGSFEKCTACLKLGAKAAIDYKKFDFQQELLRITDGEGVDVILDMIGGDYTPKNLECLRPGGRLILIATMGGAEAKVNLLRIMQKRLTISGSTMRPRSVDDKATIARELREKIWPLLESKKIAVPVDRVFPFVEAAEAHRYLESSQHIGKVILKMP